MNRTPPKQLPLLFLFIFLFILSFSLRLFKVNEIPSGFYWDEAAITYNAFGLAEWNRDEWGNKLPISFRSFGDYKAPLLIYTLSIPYKIFGLHIDWLRYLAVFVGGLNVVLTLLLFRQLIPKAPPLISLVLLILTSFTPWYFHFSRFGNEASLGMTLVLLGTILCLRALKNPRLYFVSSIFLVTSLYAYHSAKFFTPLLVLALLLVYRNSIKKHWRYLLGSLLIGCILLIPLGYDSFIGSGFERGKSLIFFEGNELATPLQIAKDLAHNLSQFLAADFWVLGKDSIGPRHGLPGFGVLLKSGMILSLIGAALTWLRQRYASFRWVSVAALFGLLPSLLSHDAPHSIRSMMAAPWILLLAGIALHFFSQLKLSKSKRKILNVLVIGSFVFESSLYLHSYFSTYARISAPEFQYGYKQAFDYINTHKYEADTFIITDKLGQPYIYSLLYRSITPEEYKFGALANYEFHEIKWPDDRKRRMYVATPEEIPVNDPAVVSVINYPDSTEPALVIALN